MKMLKEHNYEAKKRWTTDGFNGVGISCDKCGAELREVKGGVGRPVFPRPMMKAYCPNCPFVGFAYM